MYGRIESAWRVTDDRVVYSFTVPANTTATLRVPAKNMESISENGKPVGSVEGVLLSEHIDGNAVIELGSGKYEFTVIE